MDRHFNPLEYSRELVKAGVPEAQADVHANTLAHVLDECVAQPVQLETLRQELSFEFSQVRSEIGQVEARLRGEIQALKAELTRRIDLLEERMKRQQWANGLTIALLIGLYVQLYFR